MIGRHRRTPTVSSTMVLSPDDPGDGTPWIKLEPDAVAIITRDYLADPTTVSGPAGRSRPLTRRPPTERTTRTWPAASGPPSPGCGTRPRWCRSRWASPTAWTRPTRSHDDLRLGRRRCRLRHGQLPPRRRPGVGAARDAHPDAPSGTSASGTRSSTRTTTTTSASPSTGRRCSTRKTAPG
jgi:hypothetical protein